MYHRSPQDRNMLPILAKQRDEAAKAVVTSADFSRHESSEPHFYNLGSQKIDFNII